MLFCVWRLTTSVSMNHLFVNLAAKPHKLFFLGGIANALVYMGLLAAHYAGWASSLIALPLYHAYAMIFMVFTQFFTAFLFTMAPRFFATPPVPRTQYLAVFLILNLSSLIFALSLYSSTSLLAIAGVGLFAAYLMVCGVLMTANRQSVVENRYDTNWILLAFALGGLSHLLFLLCWLGVAGGGVQRAAIGIGFFLYLFMVVLTLSQKMIPFFTEGKVEGYRASKSRYFLEAVFALLVIKLLLETLQLGRYGFVVDLVLALITLLEIIKWRLPLFKVEPILWVLYLALMWIPAGFFLFFLEGAARYFTEGASWFFEQSPLHLIAIGYFTTIALGFGSRIILGHSGRKPAADRYTIGLFMLVQLVVVIRALSGLSLNLDAAWYLNLILLSAGLWMLLFLLWSLRYLKLLFEA